MFVMFTYDVPADRTAKYRKLLRRYLGHEQFSIFYGDLPPSKLEQLRRDMNKLFRDGDRVLEFIAANRHNIDIGIWSKDGRSTGLPTVNSDGRHKTDHVIL